MVKYNHMWLRRHKTNIVLLTLVVSLSMGLVMPAFKANAAGTIASKFTPSQEATSWMYYNAMSYCIKNFAMSSGLNRDRITPSDANSGKWFQQVDKILDVDGPAMGYYFGSSANEGRSNCDGNGSSWITAAFNMWGVKDLTAALCDIGGRRENGSQCLASGSAIGSGDYKGIRTASSNYINESSLDLKKFQALIKNKVYGGKAPSFSHPARYVEERNAFLTGCIGPSNQKPLTATEASGVTDKSRLYTNVQFVSDKGVITSNTYYGIKRVQEKIGYQIDGSAGKNINNRCDGIMTSINANSAAYADAVKKNGDTPPIIPSDDTGGTPGTGDEPASTCTIGGIGWIICPVVNYLAKIADSSYKFLEDDFLNVKVDMFGTDTDDPTYAAWSVMRNFANIAFVITFLIIIFSQLTGAGITNYGVKKLLPRIIIAAILVNISYFVCQIAVDLSNILGKSLSEIFLGIPLPSRPAGTVGFWSGGSWVDTAGFILAGAGITAALWTSLSALIPVLIMAVFALVMILFILVARQALIVLLVVISPLAFVAFLMPNTEQWYKKWQKALVSLLLLYPLVALIYGVSGFASGILAGVMSGTIGQIAAASVTVLPLFVIPSLLKKSLDAVGGIGTSLNSFGAKMGAGAGKKVMDDTILGQAAKYKDGLTTRRRAQIQGGTYKGRAGFLGNRAVGNWANKKFNKLGISGEFGDRRSAQGDAMVAQAEGDDFKSAQAPLAREIAQQRAQGNNIDTFLEERASSKTHTSAERAVAMDSLASMGRDQSLRNLSTNSDPDHQRLLQESISRNAGSLLSGAPDLVKGKSVAFGNVKGSQLASFSKDTAAAYAEHLKGLQAASVAPGASAKDLEAFATAQQSFNSAIEDISKDTSLQASFGGDVGRNIQAVTGTSPALVASLSGLARIQIDGKIR